MKKLFFFLALLLPIGAWGNIIVIAERDWTSCTEDELMFYEFSNGQEGSVRASKEGIVITLPKLSDEIWQPQTMILDRAFLEKGQDYTVRITAKIPSDGQLQVNMGSFSAAEHKVVDVIGSDDFQIIDIMFPDFPYTNAHILFQSGFIVGTCIIKKVQILRKVNTWTLAGDESLVGIDWDVTSTINNMITLDGEDYTITKKNLLVELK